MVEGVWHAGEAPHGNTEEYKSFKEMLITIVEQELQTYFKHGIWWWATRFALALGDGLSRGILLLEIMNQKEMSAGQYEPPGLLAIAEGKIALAEQIIRDLEKTIGEPYSDKAIVSVVSGLPYRSTPTRIMRIFEERRDYGQVFNIASAIGDRGTSERMLGQMINEGRLFDNIKTQLLVRAVSCNQELGKKLLKELGNPKEKKEWYMECAGLVAAALGETRVAEKAFQYLKEGSRFDQLQAGKIAAVLGKLSDAEEMVSIVYTQGTFTKLMEGDRFYSDSVGDIIGIVLKQNVESAERIWRHLTRVVPSIELPHVAVRVLEII